MDIIHHRGALRRTQAALQSGVLTVGFIGGSITDGRVDWNWPEPVCAWLAETFPNVRLQVENAAIGATSSDQAVFRARRDLIERGCDLVFVEYAVNDDGLPADRRMRTREGLLRKLLKGEGRDVVFTYTYSQAMYTDMLQGRMPASIADFERLADHYQIGSVWMALHALQEVQRGCMRWEEWLPDGLHPQFRGSFSYAQPVIAFLQEELCAATALDRPAIPTGDALPVPLNPANWENAYALPLADVRVEGPWSLRRWLKTVWMDQVWHTTALGSRLQFNFEGRGLLLGVDFGKNAGEFRYRLDNGEWKLSNFDRPDWLGSDGWYRVLLIADDLSEKSHHFELEVVHSNPAGDYALASRCAGTAFNLALVGIIP